MLLRWRGCAAVVVLLLVVAASAAVAGGEVALRWLLLVRGLAACDYEHFPVVSFIVAVSKPF